MFGFSKKEKKKIVYDPSIAYDDDDDSPTHVIWERYNFETEEVEETAEIEIHDEDGLEAMEELCDDMKADGEWQGYAYVYETKGVKKYIRPKDNRYPED